ncbi:MAG: hypothetical protein RLY40_1457 [Pseudomonadota bacterium]|jgi:hypothetical protein
MGKEIIVRSYNNKDYIDTEETSPLDIELKALSSKKNYGSTFEIPATPTKPIKGFSLCPSPSSYFQTKLANLKDESDKEVAEATNQKMNVSIKP